MLGSAALLAGAYMFQYMGYAPCQMCYWQRYPHFIAIAIGLIVLALRIRILALLGAAAAAVTSAIGFFHVGVEQKWWDGPASCTGGGDLSALSGADLLDVGSAGHLVMCDEVSWSLFYISMPGWNALFSLALVFLWLRAARK